MEFLDIQPQVKTIWLSEVIFDEKIYPRKKPIQAKIEQYMNDLESIESKHRFISIAADYKLLDGRHRHLAYLKKMNGEDREINVFWYPNTEPKEQFAIANMLNNDHGEQTSYEEKRANALRFFAEYNYTLDEIAKIVSVRKKTISEWTKGIREEQERQQNETILEMWLACETQAKIAKAFEFTQQTVANRIEIVLQEKFLGTKLVKLSNFELDQDDQPDQHGWKRPLYNVWTFAKKTNSVTHFGNSEQRIVENLLYLYTNPFDIVVDPFAGGGSTIDVCQRRLRRYWVSDRKLIIGREKEIREFDILDGTPPLDKRWSEVALLYLDPPYWRQAEGEYSDDPEDLANMPLDQFYESLTLFMRECAGKMPTSSHVALLIQPTQWRSDDRQVVDHVFDILMRLNTKKMILERRISCPYSTEQYNAQQVEWAKTNKALLEINRELIIWRIK